MAAGLVAVVALLSGFAEFGPVTGANHHLALAGSGLFATHAVRSPSAPQPGSSTRVLTSPSPFGRAGFSGHYYAGTEYTGSKTTATDLGVNLLVPQDVPQIQDFYYVLMSVWDNASSYDQIGFANSNGVWGVAFSTTTACAGMYSYSSNAFPLNPGTNYRFDMQLVSGYVQFSVSLPTGGVVWSTSVYTGAPFFEIEGIYTCNHGANTSVDYTNYEEVYTTSAPVPPYAFYFTNNTENSVGESQWIAWESSTAPTAITVGTGGTETIIENVPFGLSAPPALSTELGPIGRNYSENVSVQKFSADSRLTATVSGTIPNATVSINPGGGTAPFGITLTVLINPNTRPGLGYTLEVKLTDTQGLYSRIALTVPVAVALQAAVPVAVPPSTDVNRPLSVTETPIGGSGTYAYLWTGLPSGCANTTVKVTCVPTTSATFTVAVEVSDSLGFFSNSSTLSVTVHPALGLTVSGNVGSLDIGQSILYQAVPSGGSGGLVYSWTSGTIATCTAVSAALTCTSRSIGTLSVTATITDLGGSRVSAPIATRIYSDPTTTLKADRQSTETDRSVTLTLSPSGGFVNSSVPAGHSAYAAAWTGLPANCSSVSPLTMSCSWPGPGAYGVGVRVYDANGQPSGPANLTISVFPSVSVSISEAPSDPLTGQGVELTAVVAGGVGPFHYTWSGLPDGCSTANGANLSCQFQTSGSFGISVRVSDSLGENATSTAPLTVRAAFLGLPASEGYAAVGGIVAILAAVVGLAAVRYRRRRQPPVDVPPSE
ncbi:MAG: hypothetical protein L3J95_01280 [Thermoplasmata archaeon]|nr:hypothetical protein [Thermoplasmata archaeon]MCI4359049.1 hypothetical protein [Thermoplasmata archaeon]